MDLREELINAKANCDNAASAGMNPAHARERFKNILYTHADEIIKAICERDSLREEVAALDTALAESDDELRKLKAATGNGKRKAGNQE